MPVQTENALKQVEISQEIPPVYERLRRTFGVEWKDGVIIAYDGKIHCCQAVEPQKIVHECVHLDEQRRIGNADWWRLYFSDGGFRLEQELMAYRAEAAFIKRYIKNREHRFQFIRDMAISLSSGTYGAIISQQEALRLLL